MKRELKSIEQIIKEFRKAKGMSQIDLAERIGVSYQQVQKYENGASALSIARLRQIAQALDVPLYVFFPSENKAIAEHEAPYGKLDDEEQQLLHFFREINDKKKKSAVLAFLKALTQ